MRPAKVAKFRKERSVKFHWIITILPPIRLAKSGCQDIVWVIKCENLARPERVAEVTVWADVHGCYQHKVLTTGIGDYQLADG